MPEVDRPALVPGGNVAAELGLVIPLEEDFFAAGYGEVASPVKRLIRWWM